MAMEDNESCDSNVMELEAGGKCRQQRKKVEVYNEVFQRLKESCHPEAQEPAFDDQLWAHFNRIRLPARHEMDVNVERAEDVLTHKRLLYLAHDPANRPAFEDRLLQVARISDGTLADSIQSRLPEKRSFHPPPAFGSSPNLEASTSEVQDGNSSVNAGAKFSCCHCKTIEILHAVKMFKAKTPSCLMAPPLQESHALFTVDCYSLDVFVVDGWPYEDVEQLLDAVEKEVLKIELFPCYT